jgi:LPS export ABC transporter protein LptC
MPVYSRNLLLFLALSGAAALTWFFSRQPETLPSALQETARAPQGYYLVDAELQSFDDDGLINNRIFADRVEQLPGSEAFVFEVVRVQWAPAANISWQLTAASGDMPKDRSLVELHGVLLSRMLDQSGALATFETSELTLNADSGVATSSQSVIFRDGRAQVSATGMTLDMQTDTYTLEPDVTIRF